MNTEQPASQRQLPGAHWPSVWASGHNERTCLKKTRKLTPREHCPSIKIYKERTERRKETCAQHHLWKSTVSKIQEFWYIYFSFYSSFMHYIQTTVSSLSSLTSPPPPPPISHRSTPSPFPSKQKCRPPRDISKHSTTSYSKTRRKPSQEGWMRQPSRRKRFPRIGERVRDMPRIPTVRSPARTPSNTTTLVYAEDLAQI